MKQFIGRSLALILVMLIAAGCTAGGADLSATIAPQVCPTAQPQSCPTSQPQSCPTTPACPATAAKIPVGEQTWASLLAGASAITITFDPGEKCSVDTSSILSHGMHYYNIKVKDQAHATYAVLFQTLDEGKTLADLQAYSKTAQEAPSWDTTFRENYVGPGSNSFYNEDFPVGQVYISCFISTQTGILRILDYGPVEIK